MSEIQPLPCERFRLDYYLDESRRDQPNARYCECGWTEAHHEIEQVRRDLIDSVPDLDGYAVREAYEQGVNDAIRRWEAAHLGRSGT